MGAIGALTFKHERVFETLLQIDTVRGHDSTGVAVVTRSGEVKVAKAVGTPWELSEHYSYRGLYSGQNVILIGHNRAATKGKVTRNNAHPFEFDNLVGCHNGTLKSWNGLKDSTKFTVDSEALYYHINHEGLQSALGSMYGAYALTWYDKLGGQLNILRNGERTLYYCHAMDTDVMFWASEAWMLSVACSRNGVKIGDIQEFPVHEWHKINLIPNSKPGTNPVEDFRLRNVKSWCKEPPKAVTYSYGNYSGGNSSKKPQNHPQIKNESQQKEALSLVGETVEATLCSVVQLSKYTRYISCSIKGHKNVNARIYEGCPKTFKELLDLLGNNVIFNVKRVSSEVTHTGKYEYHVVPDNRTIILDFDVTGEEEPALGAIKGPDGGYITEAEFKSQVGSGCAWCGSPISVEEADDVLWLGGHGQGCICPDCKDFEEVQQYVN